MRLALAVSSLVVFAALLVPVRAQDSQPSTKDKTEKKDEPKPDAKPDEKKDPFPKPPKELEKILARWDKDEEPARELKRCFASALYYHLARDAEKFVLFFHKDLERNDGTGKLQKTPPADLKAIVKKAYAETQPTSLTLEELVDLSKIRVYSKDQAKDADDDWKKKPRTIWSVMADGDYLVIAPVPVVDRNKDEGSADVFYVMRKQDGVFKIAVAE